MVIVRVLSSADNTKPRTLVLVEPIVHRYPTRAWVSSTEPKVCQCVSLDQTVLVCHGRIQRMQLERIVVDQPSQSLRFRRHWIVQRNRIEGNRCDECAHGFFASITRSGRCRRDNQTRRWFVAGMDVPQSSKNAVGVWFDHLVVFYGKELTLNWQTR